MSNTIIQIRFNSSRTRDWSQRRRLRRSLAVQSIVLGLVAHAAILGLRSRRPLLVRLLELQLSPPRGIVLASRLCGQRSLEAVSGASIIEALGDVLAVRAAL